MNFLMQVLIIVIVKVYVSVVMYVKSSVNVPLVLLLFMINMLSRGNGILNKH